MSDRDPEPVFESDSVESTPPAEPPEIPRPRKKWHIAERSLAGGYTSLAIAGGILFFMPWVQLSCTDASSKSHVAYTQTGYQVATGELERGESLERFQSGIRRSREVARRSQGQPSGRNELESFESKVPGLLGLWAFPIGLGLVTLAGLVHAAFLPAKRPMLPFLGAASAALAIATCLIVELPISKEVETRVSKRARKTPAYEKFEERIQLERLPAFTASIWITGAMGILVLGHYGIATWKQRY